MFNVESQNFNKYLQFNCFFLFSHSKIVTYYSTDFNNERPLMLLDLVVKLAFAINFKVMYNNNAPI